MFVFLTKYIVGKRAWKTRKIGFLALPRSFTRKLYLIENSEYGSNSAWKSNVRTCNFISDILLGYLPQWFQRQTEIVLAHRHDIKYFRHQKSYDLLQRLIERSHKNQDTSSLKVLISTMSLNVHWYVYQSFDRRLQWRKFTGRPVQDGRANPYVRRFISFTYS